MIHLLLDHGASLVTRDKRGYQPLHHAVQHQHILAVEYLVSNWWVDHFCWALRDVRGSG